MIALLCLAFCCVLTGWAVFFKRVLRMPLAYGYFNATAFCALLSFISFLSGQPQLMAMGLLGGGGFLFVLTAVDLARPKQHATLVAEYLWPFGTFLLLALLCFIMAYGISFRSIDDYSFWGTMSKYLFTFNALPKNDHVITASFLTYIPALASFHYLLYTLGDQYSQLLGYFAQNIVLISAMMLCFDARNKSRSIVLMAIWYVLFSMAYGTVTLRMEVDAYVAAYFLGVAWLIYKREALAYIALPIVLLSLIKEIGLLFALCSCVLYLVAQPGRRKNWLGLVGIVLGVAGMKCWWKLHVGHLGFNSFSQAITTSSALSALNPFNAYYHPVQQFFFQGIAFSAFDHIIQVPNLVFYLFIANLWHYLRKEGKVESKLFTVFAVFALVYLFMLYLLQAIVFDVGHSSAHLLDFQRYYNMLFLPWVVLAVFITLDTFKPRLINSTKGAIIASAVVCVFLVAGKVERTYRFYQPVPFFAVRDTIVQRGQELAKKDWSVCLLNPPDPFYAMSMPLAYFLMPHRVFYPIGNELCDLRVNWIGKEAQVTL